MLNKHLVAFNSRRGLRNNPVARINPSFQEAKQIGIVFTWQGEKKVEIIQHFIEELKITGKKCQVLCFYYKKEEIPLKTFKFFTTKDFDLLGRIKSESLQQFINIKFDFLFHLDTTKNIYIEYILAHSQAKCRVSRLDFERKDFYDFMIKTGENEGIEHLCRHILHYTKSLISHE